MVWLCIVVCYFIFVLGFGLLVDFLVLCVDNSVVCVYRCCLFWVVAFSLFCFGWKFTL